MRPDSIKQFEYAYWGSIGLAVANIALNWWGGLDALSIASLQGRQVPAAGPLILALGVAISLVFAAVIPLVLWYFTARRASDVAKWFTVALGVFGALRLIVLILFLFYMIAQQIPITRLIQWMMGLSIFTEVLHMAAIGFLFYRDSREFFALKGAMPAYQTEEVFG